MGILSRAIGLSDWRFVPKNKGLDGLFFEFANDFGLNWSSGDFARFEIEIKSGW